MSYSSWLRSSKSALTRSPRGNSRRRTAKKPRCVPALEPLEARWVPSTVSLDWIRQFGTPGNDAGATIAVGGDGIYVAGRADSALSDQTSAGGPDAYLRKY